MNATVAKFDWLKWLSYLTPVILLLVSNIVFVTWYSATTIKDVEAAQTKISEIRNSDIPSLRQEFRQEFRSLGGKVDTNEGSRISMNDRLIRMEEQLRFAVQAIDRVEKLLSK